MALLRETFSAIISNGPGQSMAIPRYSKALRDGKGDRAPASDWTNVTGKIDIVLFEGWMLGFTPIVPLEPQHTLSARENYLRVFPERANQSISHEDISVRYPELNQNASIA